MNTHYYVELDGQQFGPYELEQMKTFGLMPNVLVYSTLTEEWAPVESYSELVEFIMPIDITNREIDIYNSTYYLKLGEDTYGPYSLPELSFLDINAESLLSVDNLQTWLPASEINGLLSTIDLLAESDEEEINIPNNALNTSELEELIEEQESEIVQLKDQLQTLQNKLNENNEQDLDIPVYDMSKNGVSKYATLSNELCALIQNKITIIDGKSAFFQKVFPSLELEKIYHLESYTRFINTIKQTLNIVVDKLQGIQSSFDEDIMLLENTAQNIHRKCAKDSSEEEHLLIESINQQIESIKNTRNIDATIESLKQILNTRKAEIVSKYKRIQITELENIASKKREIQRQYENLRRDILTTIKNVYEEGIEFYESYFNNFYETSKIDASLWNTINDHRTIPSSLLSVGVKHHRYTILGEDIIIVENCYVELLNNQNLIIRYNNSTKFTACQIVNSLVGRLMASSSPGKINLAMIDADEMDGTCGTFKSLNRNVFQILTRSEDIRKYLDEQERHIGNIIQNLLIGSIKSLHDYNQDKENKEAYHVIIIEDFPVGFNSESLFLLQKILRNGVRAGINVIMLINEDKINYSEDTRKTYNSCHMEMLENSCEVYDLLNSAETTIFDSFTENHLRKIVQYVNAGVEVRKEDAVLFADYTISRSEWWQRSSAKYIEIPFGISEDRQIQKLKITQESGQNSAIVIGIPGSGKSVFLHALISSAAINYSPDELNMYLIDFSGVEFNSYALHNLPHARVIAPEAEREFGLSILNELVEEGRRRMDLCRDNGVSNIVDLKAKNPSLYMPRLLVIIDEFQKIFEIDNDNISNEANSDIHIIIQEYRKFGINLILATQKLPSSYILPKDLIANRIVFKSSPNDFSALIDMESGCKVPRLQTGECIYNSESGASFDNNFTRGFLITKTDIDNILNDITTYTQEQCYKPKHNLLVFRGNDLPDFTTRKMHHAHLQQQELPTEVGIYLGEYISVSDIDVYITLTKESSNNILILGGESHVAERILYYAMLSAAYAHTNNSAIFINLNFLRHDNNLNEDIYSTFPNLEFESVISSKKDEVLDNLSKVKAIIEERINDDDIPQNHIYIGIYGFQLGRMFDVEGEYDDPSECSEILNYILKNGPFVGVFTILQCDNIRSLKRVSTSVMSNFSYRVALQMPENDSYEIIDSNIAHKLFVHTRPSSMYRAYYRDNNRNTTIKFKPYK